MKKIALCSALLSVLLLLAGCSGKSTGSQVDIVPAEAAATLVQEGGFANTEALTVIPESLLASYYAMNDAVTEYAIYIDGSGGTAREVAVLKAANAADVSKLREIVDARLATLKQEFENYRPDEMQKIQNSVIVEKENMVYMVLTDDNQKAEKAIQALYKS